MLHYTEYTHQSKEGTFVEQKALSPSLCSSYNKVLMNFKEEAIKVIASALVGTSMECCVLFELYSDMCAKVCT